MLRDIINTQNAQITFMQGYLSDAGAADEADVCENDEDSDDGDDDVPGWAIGVMAVLGVGCLALCATIAVKSKGNNGAVQGGAK